MIKSYSVMVTNKISVAIADDQVQMRSAARILLESLGYNVGIEAENGQDLITKLESTTDHPDICLLDLNMPVMDGFETAQQLSIKFPEIRILAYSVNATKAQIQSIINCGAHGFLPKESDTHRWRKELMQVITL